MAFVFVRPEEVHQRLQAVLVPEHVGGKVAVKELDAIADGSGPVRLGDVGGEGLEVQLQHVLIVKVVFVGELFFELEVLGDGELLDVELVDVYADELPNPGAGAERDGDERGEHYGFLGGVEGFEEGSFGEGVVVVVGDDGGEAVEEVVRLEDALPLADVLGEERDEVVAVGGEGVLDALADAGDPIELRSRH